MGNLLLLTSRLEDTPLSQELLSLAIFLLSTCLSASALGVVETFGARSAEGAFSLISILNNSNRLHLLTEMLTNSFSTFDSTKSTSTACGGSTARVFGGSRAILGMNCRWWAFREGCCRLFASSKSRGRKPSRLYSCRRAECSPQLEFSVRLHVMACESAASE